MVYVKIKPNIKIPNDLEPFTKKGLVQIISMIFNKKEYFFIVINADKFKDANEKRELWDLIRPHRNLLPAELLNELATPYAKENEKTLFPCNLW